MFSVVIPLYNKGSNIKQTLESVLQQTCTVFEIIVVNDGSTDSSRDLALSFNDPRIRLIDQKNSGVSAARNRGIREAVGEWIAFLDGDDLWESNHLETISNMINMYPDEKVFCTSFVRSDNPRSLNNTNNIDLIEDYFQEAIKFHFFWTSVAVIHKTVFERVGIFKEYLVRGEDMDLWARIGFHFKFVRSSLVTAIYNKNAINQATSIKLNPKTSRVFFLEYKDYQGRESSELYYLRSVSSVMFDLIREMDFSLLIKLMKKHIIVLKYRNIKKIIRLYAK